jgi:cytochrome o ubiquinol oxidase subunit 3
MQTEAAVRHREEFTKTTLGFWVYLMTDCVLFASLFATYAVLHGGTAGGPSSADIFELDFVFIETILLLVSSLTSGLALLGIRTGNKRFILSMLGVTFTLGAGFLAMELFEFSKLASEGYSWQASAFLSSYFTLVGTHGLHIAVGLLWLVVLVRSVVVRGVTNTFHKRLALFSLFWHFLDIIWIFIFTLVYLLGAIS